MAEITVILMGAMSCCLPKKILSYNFISRESKYIFCDCSPWEWDFKCVHRMMMEIPHGCQEYIEFIL